LSVIIFLIKYIFVYAKVKQFLKQAGKKLKYKKWYESVYLVDGLDNKYSIEYSF